MKQITRIFILLVIFQAVIACRPSDPPQPAAPKKVIVELTQVAAKADIHINFRQKAMNISRQIIVD